MVVWTIALTVSFASQVDPKAAPKGPKFAPSKTAAEVVTLRDGTTILGQIVETPPPKKGHANATQPILMVVRRAWGEVHQKERLSSWERSDAQKLRQVEKQRKERLVRWRRERSAVVAEDQRQADRILTWIDSQLDGLGDPGRSDQSTLLIARIPRGDVRSLEHKPAASTRLLALAWRCRLPEPETLPVDQLRESIEGRGFVVDTSRPISIDDLLPRGVESDTRWLARRAATEVAVDPGLRFLRYQDLILPDSKEPQSFDQLALGNGLSELKKLLDPDSDTSRVDPLVERLEKIEANGRVGAVVTSLKIPPDLGSASVEITLWVRFGPRKWFPVDTQKGTVRADDLGPDAGKELEDDPQIQSAFRFAEGLGLGQAIQDLKSKSLRIGAATQKALGIARSASETSLNALALPVFEPAAGKLENPVLRPDLPPENGKPRE